MNHINFKALHVNFITQNFAFDFNDIDHHLDCDLLRLLLKNNFHCLQCILNQGLMQ